MEAWLFDVYPHPRKSALVVWIKHGEVTKHLVRYQPTFCVSAEADPLVKAERMMRQDPRVETVWYDETALWLRGPKHRVLRIQPKRFQDMTRIATDLRKATKSKGYLFFDVDNQPESRWMHEQGLWSMCRLATEPVFAPVSGVSGGGKDDGSTGDGHGQDNASGAACDHGNNDSAGVSLGRNDVSEGVGHGHNNDFVAVGGCRNDVFDGVVECEDNVSAAVGDGHSDVSDAVGHGRNNDFVAVGCGHSDVSDAVGHGRNNDFVAVGDGRNDVPDAVGCGRNNASGGVGHGQINVSDGVGHEKNHDDLQGPPGPGGFAAARRETRLDVVADGGGRRCHVIAHDLRDPVEAGVGGGRRCHVVTHDLRDPVEAGVGGGTSDRVVVHGSGDVDASVGGGNRSSVIAHGSRDVAADGLGAERGSAIASASREAVAGKVLWPLRPHPEDERFTIDYPDPGLKTAWLRVQVDKQGHVAAFTDPLVSVQLGDTTWTVTNDPGSERGVLLALGEALRDTDPDVLFTKHGDRFDIPYLLHAIRRHGLQEKVVLGRDRDPDPAHPDQEGKSISTYGRWLYKTAAYYLRGRWHVDLSKKTLDSEDDRKDIHGILYLTRVSNRRAQDINRNGAGYALQQMQIDEAIDMGTALPWKRNLAEDWKDAATLCAVDRGGQIMVPAPGIYEDVAACDFSGYYPSLVVRHNLSSDTINCECCPDGPIVPELNYHVCEKNTGHQSGILKRIAPHRKWAKAVLRKAKHQGVR